MLLGDVVPIEYELWGSLSYLSATIVRIYIDNDMKFLEIKYVHDGVIESNVKLSRIKLVTSSPNPLPLVTSIIELKDRIQVIILLLLLLILIITNTNTNVVVFDATSS